jgi:DNA end-binding protein Ku
MSLVSIPVQAYIGAAAENPPVRFNQLHKECHSRIRYVKTCPIHGEVSNEEIVSGYEYAKGEYVEVDPEEIAQLRADGDRAINVDVFIKPNAIDPAYLAGKTYYLMPDGTHGDKAYQLVCAAMEAEGVHAIARMVITTREHLARLRPTDGVLAVDLLEYAAQVRTPADFKAGLIDTHPTAQETKLTRQLVASMEEKKVDLGRYVDAYAQQVRELIEAKVAGKELVTAAPAEEPHVVNLMDALKRSMKRQGGAKAPSKKSGRRVVPSVARRTGASREKKRKTG